MCLLEVFRVIHTLLAPLDTQPHLERHSILPPLLEVSCTKPECIFVLACRLTFRNDCWQNVPSGPSRDATIGEDTIRASLVSAVSDKLRWRMKEEMDRAQAELDALKRTEQDLKNGHQKLEEMISKLDQEIVCLCLYL